MHGLIFVTWENYLGERFGAGTLYKYREGIHQTAEDRPLTSRVYDDETLLAGVAAAHELTHAPVDTLLYEYGRYFIVNGLTSRLCSYLLTQVHSARDLLLAMRGAHEQMSTTADSVSPPLFVYRTVPGDPAGIEVIYDSPRKLCPLLLGAIEGAALRYGERATMRERTCMRRGDPACEIEVHFSRASAVPDIAAADLDPERTEAQRQLADLVYAFLPDQDGITLTQLQERLRARHASSEQVRPFLLLEALNHLHHAGWCANSANEPGDALGTRRYWRLPRVNGH